MPFVYLHAAAFGVWMLVVRTKPWPVTLIVSLEAIFVDVVRGEPSGRLPTGKGRPHFVESELELKTNTELTRQIHTLTTELHRRVVTEGKN